MTAGLGVIHSKIPEQDKGVMERFQLWLNLSSQDKMTPLWHRDFPVEELPHFVTQEGVVVTVIAGESHGVTGAVTRGWTNPRYLDLHLPEGAHFKQQLPADNNAFLYVYRGNLEVAGTRVPASEWPYSIIIPKPMVWRSKPSRIRDYCRIRSRDARPRCLRPNSGGAPPYRDHR